MTRTRCLAAVQLPGAPGPLELRLQRAEAAVSDCEADLVLLPEAFLPGYARVPGSAQTEAAARTWATRAAARHGRHVAVGLVGAHGSELLLVAPTGDSWSYRKRFPTWAERGAWRAGRGALIATTSLGRIGLVLCADVVQPATWEDLAGRVDLVLVAAAWTDYAGRKAQLSPLRRAILGPWMDRSGDHRDELLANAARSLGAPIVYANACGPWQGEERFSGGSRVLTAAGSTAAELTTDEGTAIAEVAVGGAQGHAPAHPLHWRAFAATYRGLTRLRR